MLAHRPGMTIKIGCLKIESIAVIARQRVARTRAR
jgi:hypothetical protein